MKVVIENVEFRVVPQEDSVYYPLWVKHTNPSVDAVWKDAFLSDDFTAEDVENNQATADVNEYWYWDTIEDLWEQHEAGERD